MPTASTLLRIDEERTVEAIASYLQDLYHRRSVSGALIGLSGGIDSAVLATLATHSLGKDSVHVAYLYDRDSEMGLALNARRVAKWLGLELETHSIEPAMRERGLYAPLIMRITHVSPLFNRFIFEFYRLILGKTPFVSSLRAGSGEVDDHGFQRLIFKSISRHTRVGFDVRHRYRREVLETKAAAHNWLLLGAANRSEWMVGWFVKGGVDDLPFQPIIGLYKTQVRQLAAFLGMPDEVQAQAPSPDMMKGITDEFALGMSYSKIDVVLDHLEGGLAKESLVAMGITEEEVHRVDEMKRLSSWKRGRMLMPLPVDGGPTGELRVQSTKPYELLLQ